MVFAVASGLLGTLGGGPLTRFFAGLDGPCEGLLGCDGGVRPGRRGPRRRAIWFGHTWGPQLERVGPRVRELRDSRNSWLCGRAWVRGRCPGRGVSLRLAPAARQTLARRMPATREVWTPRCRNPIGGIY